MALVADLSTRELRELAAMTQDYGRKLHSLIEKGLKMNETLTATSLTTPQRNAVMAEVKDSLLTAAGEPVTADDAIAEIVRQDADA